MIEAAGQANLLGNIGEMAAWLVALPADGAFYDAWARVFLVGVLPTAILAGPIFLRAYKRGFPQAMKVVLWTCLPALALLIAAPFLRQSWGRPGEGYLFAIALFGVGGFTAMLWAPVATAAAALGAWRRRAYLRRTAA